MESAAVMEALRTSRPVTTCWIGRRQGSFAKIHGGIERLDDASTVEMTEPTTSLEEYLKNPLKSLQIQD
jgi:hypothetical protein